jgi:hypothetical protein
MINRALFNLTSRLPCRLIKPDDRPYLERYYVGQLFGVTFYLHRFVSADSERHVHNHPWTRGGSVILAGSYTEEIATDLCPHAGPAGSVLEPHKRRGAGHLVAVFSRRAGAGQPGHDVKA